MRRAKRGNCRQNGHLLSKLAGSLMSRGQKGQLGSLLIIALIPISIGLASFAYDIGHLVVVQSELQTAVEAAALSGAQTLIDDPDNAEYEALQVCESNYADGLAVSNDSPDTVVTALSKQPAETDGGAVQVTAQKQVNHIFARIFNRNDDGVTATATAGPGAPIRDLGGDQAFPLVASLDAVPSSGSPHGNGNSGNGNNGNGNNGNGNNGNGNNGNSPPIDTVPLNQKVVGDTVNFYINSQQYKNSAFTSFTESSANANYINSAIDQSLGLEEVTPGFIPSISIGDNIYLTNGVAGQKRLGQEPQASLLSQKQYLIIPVITGDPAFNQSRTVVGFVSVKITGVTINQSGGVVETITGTLVQGLGKGNGGAITGTDANSQALQNLSARAVRLLPESSIY